MACAGLGGGGCCRVAGVPGLVANATALRDAHLREVQADTTRAPPQLNMCNEASALWPPKARAAAQPTDRDYLCTYEG